LDLKDYGSSPVNPEVLSSPKLGGNPYKQLKTNHFQHTKNLPMSYALPTKIEVEIEKTSPGISGLLLLIQLNHHKRAFCRLTLCHEYFTVSVQR
jgi:hypothetical protein